MPRAPPVTCFIEGGGGWVIIGGKGGVDGWLLEGRGGGWVVIEGKGG